MILVCYDMSPHCVVICCTVNTTSYLEEKLAQSDSKGAWPLNKLVGNKSSQNTVQQLCSRITAASGKHLMYLIKELWLHPPAMVKASLILPCFLKVSRLFLKIIWTKLLHWYILDHIGTLFETKYKQTICWSALDGIYAQRDSRQVGWCLDAEIPNSRFESRKRTFHILRCTVCSIQMYTA